MEVSVGVVRGFKAPSSCPLTGQYTHTILNSSWDRFSGPVPALSIVGGMAPAIEIVYCREIRPFCHIWTMVAQGGSDDERGDSNGAARVT